MNEDTTGLLITFILFTVITIILMSGKGAMLIAGYNTASEVEKDKYDPEKLSKSVGKLFLILDILILANFIISLLNIDNDYINFAFVIAMAIPIIVFVVWINVSKAAKKG